MQVSPSKKFRLYVFFLQEFQSIIIGVRLIGFIKKLDLIIQSKSFALVLRITLKVAYEKENMPLCAKP